MSSTTNFALTLANTFIERDGKLSPSPIFTTLAKMHLADIEAQKSKLLHQNQKPTLIKQEPETPYAESTSDSDSVISYGWPKEEEPTTCSIYGASPPRAPTPPPSAAEKCDCAWNQPFEPTYPRWTDDESTSSDPDDMPEAIRSSPSEGGEHTVTVPEFLRAKWDNPTFPKSHNQYVIETEEVTDITPCLKPLSFPEWVKQWRNVEPVLRPTWVVPPPIFKLVFPPLVQQAGTFNTDPFFRQQIISNSTNQQLYNHFMDPLRIDLTLHSKTVIPLIPTGEAFDLDVKYLTEMVFEPRCQFFAFTLMDNREGRKIRLEVMIYDHSITVGIMVNSGRVNHQVNDNRFAPGDMRNSYWDMDF